MGYKIGDIVTVSEVAKRHKVYNGAVTWTSEPVAEFNAVVTGRAYRYTGRHRSGSYDDPAIFTASGPAVRVWLVRRGMTNREIAVYEQGMRKCGESFEVPMRYSNYPWMGKENDDEALRGV